MLPTKQEKINTSLPDLVTAPHTHRQRLYSILALITRWLFHCKGPG